MGAGDRERSAAGFRSVPAFAARSIIPMALQNVFRALRLSTLRPRRAWLMFRIAFWVIIFSAAVKFRSLPAALQLLSPSAREEPARPADDEEIAGAVQAVLGMNFFVFRQICWKRAALLHRFLALRGLPTTIVFGLRKEPADELKGHAWLEANGKPIMESEAPNYTVTYTFPSTQECSVDLKVVD
jgi:hypothetical protein